MADTTEIDKYLRARTENIESGAKDPVFQELVGLLDEAYRAALNEIPEEGPMHFGRLLSLCRKSMLSSAALIVGREPDNSVAITRRAIEAARVALAIKVDPENAKRWLAFEQRHERWVAREEGRKPESFNVNYEGIKDDSQFRLLGKFLGMLSDAYVHFTPEYIASLDWGLKTTGDGKRVLWLNYFHTKDQEVERHYQVLVAVHMRILEAFDRCFDGGLSGMREVLERLRESAKKASDDYHKKYYGRTEPA